MFRIAAAFIIILNLVCSTAFSAQPNIVFAIADDWGWPHAGAYGDPVVKTPTFDRIARDGILFQHAYVSSPSCTPSRGAILTGRYHWQIEGAGNLWSVFPDRFVTYPELLQKAGYITGVSSKGWGPGRLASKRPHHVGTRYKNFDDFMAKREKGKPFVYWLGSSDPHRGYKPGSGKASGMKLEDIKLFRHYPDSIEVRSDVADYYFEVQRFDTLVGRALAALEKTGELENTIVVMTGDHGMPFPRCKSNNYDSGARVPLAIRWGAKVKAGRVVDDFVSLIDLAPTFMEAAGLDVPRGELGMTGQSLTNIFDSTKSGRVDSARSYVLHGKERHVPGQEAPNMGGYPCRAIRTHEYLYILNIKPDRWPSGTPNYSKAAIPGAWLADCDNGPTKTYMVNNRGKDELHRRLYELSFGKRGAYELYDVKNDPDQLHNVAGDSKYDDVRVSLHDKLVKQLKATGDPRFVESKIDFDTYKYLGGAPKYPGFGRKPKPKGK